MDHMASIFKHGKIVPGTFNLHDEHLGTMSRLGQLSDNQQFAIGIVHSAADSIRIPKPDWQMLGHCFSTEENRLGVFNIDSRSHYVIYYQVKNRWKFPLDWAPHKQKNFLYISPTK